MFNILLQADGNSKSWIKNPYDESKIFFYPDPVDVTKIIVASVLHL